MFDVILWNAAGQVAERDVCGSAELAMRSVRDFLDRKREDGATVSVCSANGDLPPALRALRDRLALTGGMRAEAA